jgi:hypothetical protein
VILYDLRAMMLKVQAAIKRRPAEGKKASVKVA